MGGIQRTTWWPAPQLSSRSPSSAQRAISAFTVSPSGTFVARSSTNSTPIMSPGPRTSPIRSSSAAIRRNPDMSSAPRAAALATSPCSVDRPDDGEPGRARHGVATERGAVGAPSPALLEAPGADDRRQGQPVRDRLGQAHDVRDDPGVLEGPHRAGPAEPRLDLVGDEQDPVLVAERAQAAQERGRGRRVAALALDRLDEDRGDRIRRRDRVGELVEVAQAALGRRGLVAVEVAVGGGEGEQMHAPAAAARSPAGS